MYVSTVLSQCFMMAVAQTYVRKFALPLLHEVHSNFTQTYIGLIRIAEREIRAHTSQGGPRGERFSSGPSTRLMLTAIYCLKLCLKKSRAPQKAGPRGGGLRYH